ncbi:MAG: ABC transporter permease [Phycisphaerales bacterium]|nr:ABC transporter permease [Phycisphaerales bacterium]
MTGVQLMQGIGVREARGFWEEAWGQVLKQPRAVLSLGWIGIVAFFAIFAPIIANGHPWTIVEVSSGITSYPMLRNLGPGEILLVIAGCVLPAILLWPWRKPDGKRVGAGPRLGVWLLMMAQASLAVLLAVAVRSYFESSEISPETRAIASRAWFVPAASAACASASFLLLIWLPVFRSWAARMLLMGGVAAVSGVVLSQAWSQPLPQFPYRELEAAGTHRAVYTLVPYSPTQRATDLRLLPPGSDPLTPERAAAATAGRPSPEPPPGFTPHTFVAGTDNIGQDVLSQLLHGCRLSITIGLVSTGIAVLIGVTIGAIMGYFGGWVDMLLFRVIEVFMAIPVLFLLIVAAAVLPKNTYVMMAIIGCVTWTGAARFTRAEFLKLRNQDFVQSARAVGLPLRSILFKHMLPNGVTPVLVDASFAVAAAIQIEAVLSFLALSPPEQASWGRLLASATNEVGEFKWWLAIFPGLAIFLTALSYNLLGEALRDAIDPKLKKARVA